MLDKHVVDDKHTLRVKQSRIRKTADVTRTPAPDAPVAVGGGVNVYVRNVPLNSSENDLMALIARHVRPVEVEVRD